MRVEIVVKLVFDTQTNDMGKAVEDFEMDLEDTMGREEPMFGSSEVGDEMRLVDFTMVGATRKNKGEPNED